MVSLDTLINTQIIKLRDILSMRYNTFVARGIYLHVARYYVTHSLTLQRQLVPLIKHKRNIIHEKIVDN